MTVELMQRASIDALGERSTSERLIELRIMPWDVIAETPQGRESFARGAFAGVDPHRVTIESGAVPADPGTHAGFRLVGRGEWIQEREDAAYLGARIAATPAGDELLALADAGVLSDASVLFAPVKQRRGKRGQTERTAVDLRRVAVLERGAYPGASVIAVRAEDSTMVEAIETAEQTAELVPFDPAPLLARVDAAETASRSAWEDAAARIAAIEAGAPGRPVPLYATFDAYARAVWEGEADQRLLARALVDQITSDSPGVMGGFGGEVRGILDGGRPGITALGGSVPLDDSGMTLDWPIVDPALDWDSLVGEQLAEKTEITSVKVKILSDGTPIRTFAGGSDISLQLIRRSRPAYREAYLRIMTIAYGRTTEAAFEADLLAKAGGSVVIGATADADAIRAALFDASAQIDDATGSPASVVLASPSEWLRWGGLPGLFPPAYGTSNVPGTAQASTLRINISGLEVVRAPYLASGVIITNGLAARWAEDGPMPISADDVAKLGQNVAVWGMGATAVYVPDGVVKSTLVTGTARSAKSE